MSQINRGGRPAKYSSEQVEIVIGMLEGRGRTPTGEAVKTALVTEFGVSSGINLQSLEAEIARQIDIREARRAAARIEILPAGAKIAANELGDELRARLVDFMAREFEAMRREASHQLVAKEADLGILRRRVLCIEQSLDAAAADVARLEASNERLKTQVAKLQETNRRQSAKLATKKREATFRNEMKGIVREVLVDSKPEIAPG